LANGKAHDKVIGVALEALEERNCYKQFPGNLNMVDDLATGGLLPESYLSKMLATYQSLFAWQKNNNKLELFGNKPQQK